MTTVEEVQKTLGDYVQDFTINVEGNYITVRANKWLKTEDFTAAKERLQKFNAEWVANGKLSHFRIHVSTAVMGSAVAVQDTLEKAYAELGNAIQILKLLERDLEGLKAALK